MRWRWESFLPQRRRRSFNAGEESLYVVPQADRRDGRLLDPKGPGQAEEARLVSSEVSVENVSKEDRNLTGLEEAGDDPRFGFGLGRLKVQCCSVFSLYPGGGCGSGRQDEQRALQLLSAPSIERVIESPGAIA